MTSSLFRSSSSRIEALEHRIAPAVALVDLGSVNGTDGFKINGVSGSDLTGISVSAAGDVNGDGRADFLVGASDSSFSYVVFGRAAAFPASFELSTLDGTNGFRIEGELSADQAGLSASRAGDVNGDGLGDLLIGAPANGATGSGAAYVIYGKRTFATTATPGFTLDLLTAPGVTRIAGVGGNDLLGLSVAAAGDVNRDGRADLLLGAPGASNFTGASFVVFGKRGGLGASFDLANLNGANGFRIAGEVEDDNFGSAVNGAGDVNGDGFADLIVGADSADDDDGAAYVIFGRARGFGANFALSSLTGANGFKIVAEAADEFLGSAVSGAGDLNRDGFGDLVIGARTADRGGFNDSGTAYVVFGKRSGFEAELALSSLTGANGFEIPGHEAGAQLGASVSRAGDLNSDGFADLILGADRSAAAGLDAGSAYALFGKRDGYTASFDLSTLDGINGFRIDGESAGGAAGASVAEAGDLNRDGFGDLLVGAPGVADTGAAYVIYGTALPVRITPDGRAAVLTDTDGDTVVVRVSKGRLGQDDFTLGPGDRGLAGLNLSDDGAEFQGASISIIASTTAIAGVRDGRVNVGEIESPQFFFIGGIRLPGVQLGAVTVEGDLGRIAAFSVSNLFVHSLSAIDGPRTSEIGHLGSFRSLGDVLGTLEVGASIGPVAIGGDLDGSMGGTTAGLIRASESIGNVVVTGSIIGGADASGLIAGVKLGRVSIGGDLTSAAPGNPVSIFAEGKAVPINAADAIAIAALGVRGDVLNARILADTDSSHSQLDSNAGIGSVGVRGHWTDSLLHSTGNIGRVTVLGSFTGANELGIVAGRRLGPLTFGGNLASLNSDAPVLIAAVGDLASATAAGHLAFASITVRGDVTNARFLAGYGESSGGSGIAPINRDASIGTVIVDGTFNASSLVAGVNDSTGDGFGRNDIPTAAFDRAGLIGRIAAVVIRGEVTNGGVADNHFGITAERIVAANISGTRLALTSAPGQSSDLGATGDIKLVEV